jgi:hypothetical protein
MLTPAQRAAAMIRYFACSTDPDKRTSLADARIALCLARGVAMDDIDPSMGYDYSRAAYDESRRSWVLFIRDEGWSDFYDKQGRFDPAPAYDNWSMRRPHFTAGDDWLAAGIAAHRERHPGPTCSRRGGRCDFHPDAEHAALLRSLAKDNDQAPTTTARLGVQESLFADPAPAPVAVPIPLPRRRPIADLQLPA